MKSVSYTHLDVYKRQKFNKAFAEIGGKSSLQIILDKFNTVFSETIIICNDPELYAEMNDKIYTDVYPGMGPVAGIHSGLYLSLIHI